jgi:hypothetical protein
MATHNGQEPAPPRERGHYSEDNRRWEETSGRWPPPTEEGDTLEWSLRMLGSSREGRCGRAQLLQRLAEAVGEEAQVREAVGVALDADVELAGIGQHGHTQGDVAGDLYHRERLHQASAQHIQGVLGAGTLVTNRSTIRWWRL